MKPLLVAIICLLVVSCGKDKENAKSTPKDTPEKYLDHDNSLLWEISGNGLSHPSYLFGTVHIIPKKHFFTGENLIKKLEKSELLVMEVKDISNILESLSALSEIYADSGQIADYVSSDLYDSLLSFVDTAKNLSKEQFEATMSNLSPLGLYAFLGIEMKGNESTEGYELYFMDLAYDFDLDLAGLETINDQLQAFQSMSYEDVIRMLILSESDASMDELYALYKEQNLDALLKHTMDDESMKNAEDDLLTKRNKNWIPKIENLIKENRCFIAVGAAHLPGNNGVIKLLRNEGYEIKAISIE
jgi:uncharacterized protein YbaP (TraB family)